MKYQDTLYPIHFSTADAELSKTGVTHQLLW